MGEIDQVPANKDNLRSAVLFEKFKPAAAALADSIDWYLRNININI